MTNGELAACSDGRWTRLLDRGGYAMRIAVTNRRTIISAAIVAVFSGFAFLLPNGTLPKDFRLDAVNGGLLAIIVLLVKVPSTPEMVAEMLRYLFRGGDQPNASLDKQVRTSVKRHVSLMRVVEQIRSPTEAMLLAPREGDEGDVVRRSLKLADSVIRERLRLHEDDDVHVTLRMWSSEDTSFDFYESNEDSRRGGRDVRRVHDALFRLEPCDAVDLFEERFPFRVLANLRARRHADTLALPHGFETCGCRSALLVFLRSGGLKIAVLFESRRAYEFGNPVRNQRLVRELIPFFITIRLALQYRVPSDAKSARSRRRASGAATQRA